MAEPVIKKDSPRRESVDETEALWLEMRQIALNRGYLLRVAEFQGLGPRRTVGFFTSSRHTFVDER